MRIPPPERGPDRRRNNGMANSKTRQDALTILRAALDAADPTDAVQRHLQVRNDKLLVEAEAYPLREIQHVYLVGMGKASARMAEPVSEVLGDRISGGTINVKYGHAHSLPGLDTVEAGHPIPDPEGMRGTAAMMDLLQEAGEHDLVICLISGGGSALAPAPVPGVSLAHKQNMTEMLLACGATIQEVNAVRKHLSRLKGGQLARLAQPATVLSMILSDVMGDDLSTIASGPTVPDPSTFQDCLRILTRHNLMGTAPGPVVNHLEAGARGTFPETPKVGDSAFSRTRNLLVGSNLQSLEGARQKAAELGYNPLLLSSSIGGETREVAGVHAAIGREILSTGHPVPPPACLISGGETTVTLRGEGKGGRNQEFALAAALAVAGLSGILIMSAGTDGTDGPTDAAGGIVAGRTVADGSTVERGREQGLDAQACLEENDSYPFFDALGDLIRTGPTMTNVMDLRLVLVP